MYEFTAPFQSPAGSPIRELFKYLSEPGMISFAGGYPATDLFDIEGLRVAQRLAYETPVQCLQYCPIDGLPILRNELISLMKRRGVSCSGNELMVTTGSQQGLDLLLRVLVAAGDTVLTEQPAYPATLQAFRLQQANVVTIPVDADGLDVERLAELLAAGEIARPKLFYTVPTFANPTGATLSAQRRKLLLSLAVKHRFLIVEDDPYADLRFSGEPVPSLLAMSAEVEGARDWVIHSASLSKIVSPGLRIGWTVGPSEIVRRCVIAKQTADLCTAPWTQATAAVYLAAGSLERHLPVITQAYQLKCQVLCHATRASWRRIRVSRAARRHVRLGASARHGFGRTAHARDRREDSVRAWQGIFCRSRGRKLVAIFVCRAFGRRHRPRGCAPSASLSGRSLVSG
jgi:DNA-binding transcriptional MocR family regulator